MPELASKTTCSGCTAFFNICQQHCISMRTDDHGFSYPVIDQNKCINCKQCQNICPVITPLQLNSFGPIAYAAYSSNPVIRSESSSGGIFSEVSRVILAQGGVVFGAAYNRDFAVRHIAVEREADLKLLRSAKYAQSYLGETFQFVDRLIKENRKVLFSGTPCQVAGLKAFLHKDYDNLFSIDFVCHAVPSPMAWSQYVKYRAEQDNNGMMPLAINLRSKVTGWSRYRYSNVFEYENGKVNTCSSSDSLFMKLFIGDYICRPSCENCPFKGYSRISDLTLGDFWGIWDIKPEMDDNGGTSLILCQSDHGAKLLEGIADKLVMKQVTLEEASRQNSSMLTASPANPRRKEALDMIRAGNIAACESWFRQPKKTMTQKLRHLVGSLLRKN